MSDTAKNDREQAASCKRYDPNTEVINSLSNPTKVEASCQLCRDWFICRDRKVPDNCYASCDRAGYWTDQVWIPTFDKTCMFGIKMTRACKTTGRLNCFDYVPRRDSW